MDVNFKDALALLSRALSMVLFRAGVIAAGGLMIIVVFGMLLIAFRLAGGINQGVAIAVTVSAVLGVAAGGLFLQRYFFYRLRAAMLFIFSGSQLPAPKLVAAMGVAGRHFSSYSRWRALNRWLRRSALGQAPNTPSISLLAARPLCQAVLALVFSRGGTDIRRSVCEGTALYLRHGNESRRLASRWQLLSTAGLSAIFFCNALPNWFFFNAAGAPIWIGLALAAVIAWVLHQAFIVPFVLAGVSAALLAETKNQTPDPDLYEKLNLQFSGMTLPVESAD
jgi:hypothetical protein